MRERHKKIIRTPQTTPAFENIAKQVAAKVPDKTFRTQVIEGNSVDLHVGLQIRAQQIAIGIPMDEVMYSQFFANYIRLSIMPWDEIITTQSTYLPEARNKIHDKYLEKGEGTHLLMLDSDVLPPPDFINRMLAHNKPMVGGWYSKKEKYPIKDANGVVSYIQRPVVYDYSDSKDDKDWFIERLQPGKGLEKVGGAGAGCWLMRRDVAEALGKSPYDMLRGGEDLVLCRKVTAAGFDMYIDWDVHCAHAGVFWV